MDDFYDFSSKLVSPTLHAYAINLKKDEDGIDDHWNLIKGKYAGIKFPVVFKYRSGEKLTDILDTGWPCLHLISDKLKIILEDNHLTGWTIFPIELYDKRGIEIPGYNGLSIIGRCGSINYKQSQIVEKRRVPGGPICKFYKGITVEGWDGSDFFVPQETYETFITKKAADLLKKYKISNLCLKSLADYETLARHVEKT